LLQVAGTGEAARHVFSIGGCSILDDEERLRTVLGGRLRICRR
jgi:hypothetical protein